MHAEAEARLSAAQAQLLQSAKLAAVGELSASAAHEINNPLYAARNSLYLVEQGLPADAPQRAFLGIAQQEVGRIARIITRTRDFYRPQLPILVLTAYDTPGLRARMQELSIDLYAAKPVDLRELAPQLRRLLRSSPRPAVPDRRRSLPCPAHK